MFFKHRLQKVKNYFEKRYEHFYILDFGRFSIKAALMERDRKEMDARIVDIVEVSYPALTIFPEKKDCDLSEVHNVIKDLFSSLKKTKNRIRDKKLVIGLSSELINGLNYAQIFTRENPNTPIDIGDIKNMIHKLELRAYEEIRKRFMEESGYAETDVILINPTIQKLQIDGKNVSDLISKEGKEILVSIFNAYAPSFYKDAIEGIAKNLKFNTYDLIYTPYAVFSALKKQKDADMHGLLVDIGGGTTRVTLARRGRIEDIKYFSFGGNSFTGRIANHFNVPESEAENIKIKYCDRKLSSDATKSLDGLLQKELNIFLSGLEMVLRDFSHTTILPSDIYLYGGGGTVGLMDAIIKKKSWKKDLIFSDSPKLHRINLDTLSSIKFFDIKISDPRLISIAGISDYILDNIAKSQTVTEKTLTRIFNLVTS